MSKSNSGPTRPTSKRSSNGSASTRSNVTTATKRPGGRAPARAPFRTRHPLMTALIPVGLVLAVVATMVVIKATGGSAAPSSSHLQAGGANQTGQTGTTALSSAVAADLTVPAATLDAVGSPSGDSLPTAVGDSSILEGADGKPVVTYVGAEYCPYCAAERWALAVALSRFGTFTDLSATHSASDDVYPDTQTLSFYGSSYSSPYVDFQPVEEATNQVVNGTYPTLQTPTAAQSTLLSKYDQRAASPSSTSLTGTWSPAPATPRRCLQGLSRRRSPRSWTTRPARWPRPSTARRTTSRQPSAASPATSPAVSATPRPSPPSSRSSGRDVTMAALGRPPSWAVAASLGLSLLAVAIASYLTVTHYADPAALACPDTGVVNSHSSPPAPSPWCWGSLSPSSALSGPWWWSACAPPGPGTPGPNGSIAPAWSGNGSRRGHGRLSRLHRAVSDRRHLPVVHCNACDSGRAFRRGSGRADEGRRIGGRAA